MGPGWHINTTVSNSIVSMFLCPSDNMAPFPVPAGDPVERPAQQLLRLRRHDDRLSGGRSRPRASSPRRDRPTASRTSPTGPPIRSPSPRRWSARIPAGIKPRRCRQLFRNGTNVDTGIQPCARSISTTPARTITWVLADINTCQAGRPEPCPGHVKGSTKTTRGSGGRPNDGGFTLINTVVPPSSTQYSFACCNFTTSSGCDDGSFQNVNSMHPGGANVLFADGSVHFLKSSIAIKTYWALGTKANGEVISSDSY